MKQVLEARKTIASLKAEGLALLDKVQAEKRAITVEEDKRDKEIDIEIATLNDMIDKRLKKLNINEEVPHMDIEVKPAEKFKSLGEQLQAVRDFSTGRRQDNRLIEQRTGPTGMSEGIPADGGFMVQTDFANTLLEKTFADSGIISRVNRIPISASSNALKIPAIAESSRADGSRQGGIREIGRAHV